MIDRSWLAFFCVAVLSGCGPILEKGSSPDMAAGGSGGTGGGDGGSASGPDMSDPPVVTSMCPHANDPPLASGTCQVTAGTSGTLITGTILIPGSVMRGGQVYVDASGTIQCVACDCTAMAASATTIDCPTGVVSPGLINTHDHITYTQNAPVADSGERYEHRNDWRNGDNGHTKISYMSGATAQQVSWGEVR
ncbi:MAG TPA: hypothetical protein VGL86_04740, partial [Polyangia bacterium]